MRNSKVQINAINKFNQINFRQKNKIEEYKKLQEARNFKATHFSELSPAEQGEVFIRIIELNQGNEDPLGKALEKFLRTSYTK